MFSRVPPLGRRSVAAIAATLLVGTAAILLATIDMGSTRDDSFYYDYAEAYQGWFVSVEHADSRQQVRDALGRQNTVGIWRGNFEHPPLMKTLFGFSWRIFARKDRRAARPRSEGGVTMVTASGLTRADGFEVGAPVFFLRPQRVGEAPDDPARRVAAGKVVERAERSAEVALVGADAADLKALCQPEARPKAPRAPPEAMSDCQVREDRALHVMSETAALRMPAILTGALAVMLTFLLGVAMFDWLTGLFGALAFLFVPRHFFHAHLACFDMPIVAFTLLTLYAFWRARDDRRWALGAGVAWGLALLTKHNAFFLAVPLVIFWLWCGRDRFAWSRTGLRVRLRLPPIPLALLAMPVVAFTMLFVFWPKLWYDPFVAVSEYFLFHLNHVHYFQWYFGNPLEVPPFPFAYPFVMTALTVPAVFLVLAFVGLLTLAPPTRWGAAAKAIFRRAPVSERERAVVFALLNGLIPILLIAMPNVPIFGGVKHWMTGMPFILLIAGFGLSQAVWAVLSRLRAPTLRLLAGAAVTVVVFAHPVKASLQANPFGTAYYNSVVAGGVQGAADLQMHRLFWGYTTRAALDWLNRNAPRNARVFWQNTTHGAYRFYQRDGLLRADIKYHGGPHGADIALIEPQKSFAKLDIDTREALGVAGPLWTVDLEGVPVLRVYAKPSLGLPRPGEPMPAASAPDRSAQRRTSPTSPTSR